MRTATLVLLASFTLGVSAPALGADLDYGVLRGPDYEPEIPVVDWNGIYLGGHGGYSSAHSGFKNAYRPLVANELRDPFTELELNALSMLASRGGSTDGASYGAFIGFNYQFEETVVGIEADYIRFDRKAVTSDSIVSSSTDSLGYLNTVNLSGSASARVEDYGTLRARGGYAIGNFLPYITGGLAVGRVHTERSLTIKNYVYSEVSVPEPRSIPKNKAITKTMGGFALGAGLEFALTQNILLRGEYQYVMLNDFEKSSANGIGINTVRAGAAVKF